MQGAHQEPGKKPLNRARSSSSGDRRWPCSRIPLQQTPERSGAGRHTCSSWSEKKTGQKNNSITARCHCPVVARRPLSPFVPARAVAASRWQPPELGLRPPAQRTGGCCCSNSNRLQLRAARIPSAVTRAPPAHRIQRSAGRRERGCPPSPPWAPAAGSCSPVPRSPVPLPRPRADSCTHRVVSVRKDL